MQLAEGFGNYLYIIFAVVYVIYSIIKAGKKVTKNRPTIDPTRQPSPTINPPTSSPIPEQSGGDELKKMLEEMLGGGDETEEIPEKPVLQPKPVPVFEKPKPIEVKTRPQPKPRPVLSEEKPSTPAHAPAFIAHPEVVKQAFSEPLSEEEAGNDFDVRQAVLYSEILKRPQY